jgi:hypothetical protein
VGPVNPSFMIRSEEGLYYLISQYHFTATFAKLCKPDVVVRETFLGACRVHGKTKLG